MNICTALLRASGDRMEKEGYIVRSMVHRTDVNWVSIHENVRTRDMCGLIHM